MTLDHRIKIALDETRLLILVSQVLFGFLFDSAFQSDFAALSWLARQSISAALLLMVLSMACLIAPSMQHRLVEAGQSTPRLQKVTAQFAGWGMLPFLLSLGIGIAVVLERPFGRSVGLTVGACIIIISALLWYALPRWIGNRSEPQMINDIALTPLTTKVEQMLTEARLILPGCQALLGFQLIVMLTHAFDVLPAQAKLIHAAGLCLVTLATILLMTPPALHRQSFGGDDSGLFLKLGSGFVIAAPLPLAFGIAADIYVVFQIINGSAWAALIASLCALLLMLSLWYVYPLILRARLRSHAA